MAFEAITKISPSHTEPRLVLTYAQRSGAFNALPGKRPKVQIGSEDKAVYIHKLDVRTTAAVNQSATNMLPSPSFKTTYISTPTYLVRNRAEYDHHDIANAGNWNVALPEAYRKANRQGFFQFARRALLQGVQPSNGEGLLNGGGTAVNFPPDANAKSTLVTMDPDWVFSFLNQAITDLRTRIMAISQGNIRINILSSQRVIGRLQTAVVELTSFQRVGGGSNTIGGTLEAVQDWNDVDIEFTVDDTLVGAGAGGADIILINAPELINPQSGSDVNTNEFATLQPGLEDAFAQYFDMDAPRELPAPLPAGAIDVTFEMRMTSGWVVRPEALTLVSVVYQ